MTTAAAFVAKARSYEGTREGAGNSNPFSRYMGRPPEYWCGDYVGTIAKQTGLVLPSYSASTLYSAAAFRAAGRWSTSPAVGSIVYFYSSVEGRIAHMGIVVSYTPTTVTVVAGNTSAVGSRNGDRVATKTYPRYSSSGFRIVGYGRPAFTAPPTGRPTPKPTGSTTRPNRAQVMALQRAVHVTVDGAYGPQTYTALELVRSAINRRFPKGVRATQHAVGTSVDGIWGPHSAAALTTTVRAIQRAIGTAADGIWGPLTERAYQVAKARNYGKY